MAIVQAKRDKRFGFEAGFSVKAERVHDVQYGWQYVMTESQARLLGMREIHIEQSHEMFCDGYIRVHENHLIEV